MHTQIDRFFKYFFEKIYPLTCLNREAKKWGCFGKKIKSPFTCLKWERNLGGVFLKKFFEKQKSPLNSSNREEKVGEILLNFKLMHRNSEQIIFISALGNPRPNKCTLIR